MQNDFLMYTVKNLWIKMRLLCQRKRRRDWVENTWMSICFSYVRHKFARKSKTANVFNLLLAIAMLARCTRNCFAFALAHFYFIGTAMFIAQHFKYREYFKCITLHFVGWNLWNARNLFADLVLDCWCWRWRWQWRLGLLTALYYSFSAVVLVFR